MLETFAQAKATHGPDRGLHLFHRRQGRPASGPPGRDKLEPHGVTPTQYAVLKVLSDADGQTRAELGARLGIDSATTTGVADRLATNGLLERRPDPQDRRLQRLFLTSEARSRQRALDSEMDELDREVESELGADAGRLRARLRRLGARKA
jgi:MarR family transcriptional regulator, organic hydroperoxide resistance regulator